MLKTILALGPGLLLFSPLQAQSTAADSLFRLAQAAWEQADTSGYQRLSEAAARALPAGNLNRPFLQYHAARANALLGRADSSVAWLGAMLDENIEGLMAWYAQVDSAFDRVRASRPYRALVNRSEHLPLGTTPLGRGVELITGAGGNVVVARGEDGALVVDAGYEPAGPGLRQRLPGASGARWIVLTHAHEDHVGGVPALGPQATVFAHPHAIATLGSPQEFIPGVSAPAKPFAGRLVAVTEPRRVALSPTDTAVILPLPAHSGGDLLVWLPQARVLHTGDNFLPGANPFLELGGIRDIRGYLAAMGAFLSTLPDDTRVVPGHGPVSPIADLRAIYRKTTDGVEFVRERKAAGASLDQIKIEGAGRGLSGPWVERAYRRL